MSPHVAPPALTTHQKEALQGDLKLPGSTYANTHPASRGVRDPPQEATGPKVRSQEARGLCLARACLGGPSSRSPFVVNKWGFHRNNRPSGTASDLECYMQEITDLPSYRGLGLFTHSVAQTVSIGT